MIDLLRNAIPRIAVRGRVDDYALHDVAPNMVVEPRSAEEAAEVFRLASENGWRIECAGAGTQCWGNRRTRADIVVSTNALKDVVEYEPADLVIGVQAGMPLSALQRATRKHAQFLGLDPAVHEQSSIGGVIATGRSGPWRQAFGTSRDHVLGLQLVTGDGRVLQLGGRVVKNVAGFDLVRLLVGSAGTLGLITSAYVRLQPAPQADETMLVSAGAPDPLLELAQGIVDENLEAVALELLSAGALTESWVLLVRLSGSVEGVQDARARIENRARSLNAEACMVPVAEWERLARLELAATTVVRLADLPARLDNTLQIAHKLLARINGACHLAAHAGAGVVRVFVAESPAEEMAFAIGEARSVLGVSEGTVTVQSSSAELMRRVDAFGAAGATLPLMKRLKEIFDPAGILAPGRFVM